MNIAIVTDDLIQKGGQEKLVEALSDLWPNAPIYTSVASEEWLKFFKKRNITVHTSFMQKLPWVNKLSRYYFVLNFFPMAFERFDFSNFDVVLSVSARYAHTVVTKPSTLHVCYMNTPGRMFWESESYFEKENYGLLKPIKKLSKPFLSLPLWYSRLFDYIASNRVDFFIANSQNSQRRIKKYYQRNSEIIYPFADTERFENLPIKDEGYFLVITRLLPWKRVDIAIDACKKLNRPLKIIGEGPDKIRLMELAAGSPNIEFLGYGTDEGKIQMLQNCSAVINTQYEDFGIVPVEAMACGKPVIAFGRGGALETVIEGRTGLFFYEQTSQSLEEVLNSFNALYFEPTLCRNRAAMFSKKAFLEKIQSFIEAKYSIL